MQVIARNHWERDNAISEINSAGHIPVSFYLSDIKAWLITTEESGMQAVAREKDVIQWARDRNIFETATPVSQHGKTLEEVNELTLALMTGDKAETKDAIGDIAVTLILQAHMHGWTLGECLESAYQVIKDRKGKMVDGVFVKE